MGTVARVHHTTSATCTACPYAQATIGTAANATATMALKTTSVADSAVVTMAKADY
jgi:hypothetical protein